MASILGWFAIRSSSFVKNLHHVLSVLDLHGMARRFIELHKPFRHNKAVIREGGALKN